MPRFTDRCADLMFAAKRRLLGRGRVRRTRLYCVGTAKSGTHSVTGMFSETVRGRHESGVVELLENIFAWQQGRITEEQFAQRLHARDRKLALEVDATWVHIATIDILLRDFSNARVLLTIRDCYSWCNSMMNHSLRFAEKINSVWREWLDSRFRPDLFQHATEERMLKDKGLYTLDGYLSYWAKHNEEVLAKVPPPRLLTVRTDQLRERALDIADFAGLPRRAIRLERTHEFRNPTKHDIIRQIDRNFLEAKVEKYCKPLMTRFFPEIRSLDDARL